MESVGSRDVPRVRQAVRVGGVLVGVPGGRLEDRRVRELEIFPSGALWVSPGGESRGHTPCPGLRRWGCRCPGWGTCGPGSCSTGTAWCPHSPRSWSCPPGPSSGRGRRRPCCLCTERWLTAPGSCLCPGSGPERCPDLHYEPSHPARHPRGASYQDLHSAAGPQSQTDILVRSSAYLDLGSRATPVWPHSDLQPATSTTRLGIN